MSRRPCHHGFESWRKTGPPSGSSGTHDRRPRCGWQHQPNLGRDQNGSKSTRKSRKIQQLDSAGRGEARGKRQEGRGAVPGKRQEPGRPARQAAVSQEARQRSSKFIFNVWSPMFRLCADKREAPSNQDRRAQVKWGGWPTGVRPELLSARPSPPLARSATHAAGKATDARMAQYIDAHPNPKPEPFMAKSSSSLFIFNFSRPMFSLRPSLTG